MWRNKFIYGCFALLGFAILLFLYEKTGSLNEQSYTQTISNIRDLQRIDADWSAQALKTRATLNQDFDALANILPQLRNIKTSLLASDLNNRLSGSDSISKQLNLTLRLLNEKENLIEQFKSNQAILKNSLRFLPTAAKDLIKLSTKYDKKMMTNSIRNLLHQIHTQVLLPDNNTKDNLLARVDLMFAAKTSYPNDLSKALSRFTAHARLVLVRQSLTKQLLDKAISTPTADAARNLVNAYNARQQKKIEDVERYRIAQIAFTSLLALALIYIGLKLRLSYRQINAANIALTEANETLEQKIEERTKKLQESQSQLVQSEKMAVIGQMVAGVAHEINTPLGYVHSNVEIMQDIINVVDDVVGDFIKFCAVASLPNTNQLVINNHIQLINNRIKKIKDNDLLAESKNLLIDAKFGLDQIADIVVNLKEFNRMDRSTEEEFDVNEGLESTLKIAYNAYKYVAKIIKEFGDVPKIFCLPSQITQVFLNIITNAAHAVSNVNRHGLIKIKTGSTSKTVYISIQDNGIGMPNDIQKRIFDPFYTTKDVGKGTGLGLSISHTIIKDHHGTIKLLSKPGIGSNFLIVLPIYSPKGVKMIEAPKKMTA